METRAQPSLSLHRVRALLVHELKVWKQDPGPPLFLLIIPLLLMAFLKDAFRGVLVNEGYESATGAEQAIPGMLVMFNFFHVTFVGLTFFRDETWGVRDRLRASAASSTEIILSKLIPPLVGAVIGQALLFNLGFLLFGLRSEGSFATLMAVSASFSFAVIAVGCLIAVLCRTTEQLTTVGNLSAILFGGIGGAIVPHSVLPRWVRAVSPFVPTHWAMRGFQQVILDDASTVDVGGEIVALIALGAILLAGASLLSRSGWRGNSG